VQGLVSLSDLERNWKADQYRIWVNWARKKATSIDPEAPAKTGQLEPDSIANAEANRILLAVKSARYSTPHMPTVSPLRAAVQPADSSPQPKVKTPPSSFPKKAVKGGLTIQDH